MNKKRVFISLLLTVFISLLLIGGFHVGLAQAGQKRALEDAFHIKADDTDNQPIAKRTRSKSGQVIIFMAACDKANITLKKCKRKLKKLCSQCANTETESIPSDSEYNDPEDVTPNTPTHEPLLTDDLTFSQITRDTVEEAHRKACFLLAKGEPSLAAESLESTIFGLQHQNIATNDRLFSESLKLFQLWVSLPGIAKNKPEAQQKITHWMTSWPTVNWLDHGSEVLTEMLAEAFEMEDHDDSGLPGYNEIWLDDVLASIEELPARNSIKYLVQALSVDDPVQKEKLHRNAILTGYSHPLPFLQMIAYLVSQQRYKEADHIFEIYQLVVIFNTYWNDSSNASHGPEYSSHRELYRLQGVFKTQLDSMRKQVHTMSNRYLPLRERLDDSLTSWPESSRHQVEDMMFEKTFDTPWNMREPIIEFSLSVISRSRQRWLDSGKMEAQVTAVQNYIRTAYASRALPVLHEQLALMLTDLGREREATDLLYKFVSGYEEGVGTEYDLSLYLIAVAHELSQLGISVLIPSYNESMELVTNIRASAQGKALDKRLQKIRREARTDDADTDHLHQLYRSIPEELTEFNPSDSMVGFFDRMLVRGLAEAKKQKLYSGSIPDLKSISELYYELDRKNGRLLQLLTPTFQHADIEEMTGLYLEALNRINDEPLSEKAIALQWLAHSKWLALHDPSLSPLSSLQESQTLIETAAKFSIDVVQPLKTIRDLKWPNRTPEAAHKAKRHYLSVINKVKRKKNLLSFHPQRVKQVVVPFYLVPPGYDLHNVPADGLCMYHALSKMYGVSLHQLLHTMFRKLHAIHQQIVLNSSENLPWAYGLSFSTQQMIQPIIHTNIDGHHYVNLEELEYAVGALGQAIAYSSHDCVALGHVWGMDSLLNTAAVALSELLSSATPFIAQLPTLNAEGTAYTGASHFMQFNPDGSNHAFSDSSLNGLPLLIHMHGNHWMYALQAANEAVTHLPLMTPVGQLADILSNINFDHSNPQNLHHLLQGLNLNFGTQLPFSNDIFLFSAH
ncbi:MAG: hypothetical protein ACR2PX_22390 [Endozoicomonas sp.]|uniref:hypothetical protein n=1 Tax=Endozoicomonas sp. TaxID=1892382 RepID=UPI003D9BCD3E